MCLYVPLWPFSEFLSRFTFDGLILNFNLVIARVTLEVALRKGFDYLIPPELADQVDVGSRVQVPFGPRKVAEGAAAE